MKPILAITMGDPAGIGAEVILKAFSHKDFFENYKCLVIGEKRVLEFYRETLKINSPEIKTISQPSEYESGKICVIDIPVAGNDFETGKVSAKCGEASFQYIEKSINSAKNGEIDAVITCPINKEALHLSGHNYPGHTEIFAEKYDSENFTMLFKVENVSVVHCTTHCSLRQAIDLISTQKVKQNILLLNEALMSFGIKNPRIAVSGLNPHAGENGLFGREEIERINPAVEWAKQNGINANGAFAPDTVFVSAFNGNYDGVVSMLHDHGFVALKSRDFESGVNITVGLPVIRTSVGHGTAFDIAGKGVSNEKSLLFAIDDANRMAKFKEKL
ncbi:MAG: 4-hydroxythreonine-4-phosphate dehydrogenase PdxA [Chitinispirillales bacterium]|jgi:4-hydroxythreonine-4-phosphate dehydrogenase|nr:4-hydroxythreonine-4-phosphate dehydrogenase PdxA [Chitinispirillales bacterium]